MATSKITSTILIHLWLAIIGQRTIDVAYVIREKNSENPKALQRPSINILQVNFDAIFCKFFEDEI